MTKLKHAAARRGRWGPAQAAVLALAAAGFASNPVAAQQSVADAQSLTAQLASDLASQPSATAVLRQWCEQRDLAEPAEIVAERQTGRDKPASAKIRALLQAAPDETILHRKVALACGDRVLSRADNWYRPGQLTATMNDTLESTDTPFGVVVQPLQFHRQSLEARVLIKPDAAKVPAEIIRNKALLETPDGTPFSLVEETYSRALLDFGPKTRAVPRAVRQSRGVRAPRQSRVVIVGETIESEPREHRHREPAPRAPRAPRAPHSPRAPSTTPRVKRP